jgi:cohesin complex subunit SCC1
VCILSSRLDPSHHTRVKRTQLTLCLPADPHRRTMFYSAEMLTKRGPLARVWMASHLSTKLTKSNLLSTSIPASVTSILGEALLPMALRLSGQLLLGVARIYSRKAKYLLDDCNETLVRVKRAFRPGGVDMDESGEGRSREAVTLRAENGGLDDILNYEGNYW